MITKNGSDMEKLEIEAGWLVQTSGVRHHRSPNYDKRPKTLVIDLLVIHHISLPPNQFGGDDVLNFFCNQLDCQKHPFYAEIAHLKVSAHVFIRRNGEIIQLVSFDDRAWHAGQSNYQGREACNDFSIGIELEGDGITPYRYGQYKALQILTRALQASYSIETSIVGHEDIAPGRKTDPGPTFDWQRYWEGL